jgi:hypothetical protein
MFAALAAVAVTGAAGCGPDKSVVPVAQGQAAPAATPAGASSTPADTATGAAAGGGACDLLTAAAVTAAVGTPYQQSQASPELCIYDLSSDASQQVIVHILANQADIDAFTSMIESASTHIDGVGDDAFYSVVGGVVFVRTGDRAFTITSAAIAAKYLSSPDGARAPFVALATMALSNFS